MIVVAKFVSRVILPFRHSTEASPAVPGGQRQTNAACSRIHSAPLPQPNVRQSTIVRSVVPVKNTNAVNIPKTLMYSQFENAYFDACTINLVLPLPMP